MKTGKKISAGIIPIHQKSRKILMIQRGSDQSHPNVWSFFGGKFENFDENPKETAKREFSEESGKNNIKYNISTKPIFVSDDNHSMFYNYIGIFSEQFVPNLEKEGECQDYGWFSLEELPNNMHPGAIELFNKKLTLIKKLFLQPINNSIY